MNGEIPGTGRFTPRGSGGAATEARGKRSAGWASETFLRVASAGPPTSPIAAAARPTPAATRKCRRAVAAPAPAGAHPRNGSSPLPRGGPDRGPVARGAAVGPGGRAAASRHPADVIVGTGTGTGPAGAVSVLVRLVPRGVAVPAGG